MSTVDLSKHTVNLSKGEKINLSKSAEGLSKIMVGLGWDPATDAQVQQVTEVIKPGFNYPDGIFFCGDICTGRNYRAERCGCNCAVYSNSRGFQSSSC